MFCFYFITHKKAFCNINNVKRLQNQGKKDVMRSFARRIKIMKLSGINRNHGRYAHVIDG